MVLPEVDEASPDSNSDAFSSDPSSPTYNPDAANNSTDIDTPSVILPSGQALPLWTVPAIRSQFSQNPRYPDPFTSFSVVAKILGYTETSRNNIIASHINHTQICISRPLSSVEVQAEAFYHATRLQIEYKSSAVGIVSFLALAAFRQNAARTRPGFITPYARRVLGDSLGNLYIRISRFGVYAALGKLQGSLIGVIVGSNKIKEMSRNDPNIPELRRDKAEFRNWTEEEIKRKLRQRREGGPKEPFFPTSKEIVMRKKQHSGDGEVRGEGEVEENVTGDSRNALLNLDQNPYKRPDDKQSDSGNSSRSADPLSKLFNEPSASSTYSSPSTSSSPGQANPGESSWDRIRRERLQAERENGQTRSGVRVPSSEEVPRVPKTDSFTFSDSDRERQLAQAEAQRDFDARVERERRGETGWGRR